MSWLPGLGSDKTAIVTEVCNSSRWGDGFGVGVPPVAWNSLWSNVCESKWKKIFKYPGRSQNISCRKREETEGGEGFSCRARPWGNTPPPPKPLCTGSRWSLHLYISLTSSSCVLRLHLAQVLTTEGCCGVSEAWLIHSGFGWGLGALLWKPSSLSTVYFGRLVFWHSLKVNAEGEPLNKRTTWEMYCWFGYFGRAFSRRERERLALPTFGLAWWTMMDLTYFCVIPMLIFLLYIVHRTWQSCYGGLPRDILMGSWWKWKLTFLWPPPQCSLFFLPLFSSSFHSHSLSVSSTPTAGRTQL